MDITFAMAVTFTAVNVLATVLFLLTYYASHRIMKEARTHSDNAKTFRMRAHGYMDLGRKYWFDAMEANGHKPEKLQEVHEAGLEALERVYNVKSK